MLCFVFFMALVLLYRSAKIRIHINNQGSNAYKADLFGSAIIIERGINTKASESYVLRNVDGTDLWFNGTVHYSP